jgi:hypothetical protein
MPSSHLLLLALKGYLLTIAVEIPVLCWLLSKEHSLRRRVFAGLWLTACSYPFVIFVFPTWFDENQYLQYVITSELLAPVSECILFWLAYLRRSPAERSVRRDLMSIIAANLCSFLTGVILSWLKVPIFK